MAGLLVAATGAAQLAVREPRFVPAAGLLAGVAVGTKPTAWPVALALLALLAHAGGHGLARRFAAVAAVPALLLCLPTVLRAPGLLLEHVVAFPAGLAAVPSPAGSINRIFGTWTGRGHTLGRMDPVTDQQAKVVKSDAEWRQQLTPAEYQVLRQAGTERPFTGEYTDTKTAGVYSCRACGAELFRSDTKFESHCGWPSFFTPLAGDAVIERVDHSMGMKRVEVLCASCHSHLGHVFEGEGYDTPTDLRYCINSVSLHLEPRS
jgi:peptide-methionine (R)-S-oxide reductase